MLHRFSWPALARAVWGGLRYIAGPKLPLPVAAEPEPLTHADIDEFARKLDDGVIDASDFAR